MIRFLDTFGWRTVWVSVTCIVNFVIVTVAHYPLGLYALEDVRLGEVEGGSCSSAEEGWLSR